MGKRKIQAAKKPDWVLYIAAFLLCLAGFTALYSARLEKGGISSQLFACLPGILVFCFAATADITRYTQVPYGVFAVLILMLLSVFLFGIGKDTHGAASWIRLGAIGIQPSEPAKILFALCFGSLISAKKEQGTLNRPKTVLFLCFLCAVVVLLVMLQNDTGTALVFAFMFGVMYIGSGLSVGYAAVFFGFCIALSPLLWRCLAPYQKERIFVFLNPERDPLGAGYQVMQSKTAIGSGGFWGKGFLKGPMNRLGLLPENDTDFIFSVIGEEFGFLGCCTVTGLLFLLMLRILRLAMRVKQQEQKTVLLGLFAMFLFHTTENIGMCLGLLPVTGIPLPFLSGGGSHFITCLFALGLIYQIDKNAKTLIF